MAISIDIDMTRTRALAALDQASDVAWSAAKYGVDNQEEVDALGDAVAILSAVAKALDPSAPTAASYAVVVRWEDPEPGAAAYGPYTSQVEAEADLRSALDTVGAEGLADAEYEEWLQNSGVTADVDELSRPSGVAGC